MFTSLEVRSSHKNKKFIYDNFAESQVNIVLKNDIIRKSPKQ